MLVSPTSSAYQERLIQSTKAMLCCVVWSNHVRGGLGKSQAKPIDELDVQYMYLMGVCTHTTLAVDRSPLSSQHIEEPTPSGPNLLDNESGDDEAVFHRRWLDPLVHRRYTGVASNTPP